MAEDNPKYNLKLESQTKGLAIGDNNIIYNYFGYREEVKAEPVAAAEDNLPCPYRGLYHFNPNDAEFFFGREVFVDELFEATQNRNFIPVLGASGSGKSSVVFAGLVPKLEQEGHWKFTHFRPGPDPFHALALALVPLYNRSDLDPTDKIIQARKLAKSLSNKQDSEDKVPLSDIFATIKHNNPNHRLLLIADQFEELYTQCSDSTVRRRFLDCLLTSFQFSNSGASSSTVLVKTMRADFLANALSYPLFGDLLKKPDVKIRSMKHSELEQVIVKPAKKLNVTFQEGLVERILNDVEDEPGNLPLLEFALTELWKKRTEKQLTHDAYEAIGQVKGALADYANDKYEKLTAEEKEQARRIFIQLVRPGEGTEDTRRRANRAELGEENWDLITRKNGLADSRLVVTSRNDSEQETVEVVHEALIQNWSQLRGWMEADRKFRVWQEQLRVVSHQWENTNRDDGALLRGVPLAEAEDWQRQRKEELSQAELDLIQLSLKLRHREKTEKERQEREKLEDKVALDTAKEKNLILAGAYKEANEANRKAKQRIRIGSVILIVSLFMAGIASYRIKLLNQVEKTLIATIGRLGIEKRDLLYYTFGDPDKAIDYLEKSLETARQIKDRRGEGYALGNLGIAYYAQGDYGKAIDYHQQHLTIAQDISDLQGEGEALGNLGKVYFIVGQYDRAIEYHKKHLEISQSIGDRQSEAYAMRNLGTVSHAQKYYDKAIDYHHKHLAISQQIQDVQGEGQALGNLGIIYQAQGEYAKAIEYHHKHLTISQEIQDVQGEGQALVNLGKAYLALEKREQGIDYLQDGLEIARKIKDLSLEGIALANLGNTFLRSGNLFLAEKNLRASIQVLESLRARLEDTHKISILETQANIYRDLQKVLIAQNKPDVALEISERMRARAFVELLAKRLSPKSNSQMAIQPPSIRQIQQIAKKHNATLVEYSMIYGEQQSVSELFIWVVSPTGKIEFRQVDLSNKNKSFLELLDIFHLTIGLTTVRGSTFKFDAISPRQRLQQPAQQLYQLLIEPIDELLPNDPTAHVIFIPHKEIFTVAFPTLQDAEYKYLINKHTILTAPSIQALDLTYRQRQRMEGLAEDVLIVGNPETKKFSSLPGAEQEVIAIAEMFNSIPIIGDQATETVVVSKMPTSKIIHFATHAIMTNKIDTGAIILAASETDDGFLTSEEIGVLKLNAELVVLAGCHTGRGKLTEEGIIGLSRSFFTSGVTSLVAALWYVPDTPTAFLMVEFYRNWQEQKLDKAQALRQAMLTTMKQYPNPRYWAGFTLIGEAI